MVMSRRTTKKTDTSSSSPAAIVDMPGEAGGLGGSMENPFAKAAGVARSPPEVTTANVRNRVKFVGSSLIGNKFAIDTSTATVEESLQELVRKLQPFITDADRLRMLAHRSMGA